MNGPRWSGLLLLAILGAPAGSAAAPTNYVVDHLYLETPPEVRLFIRPDGPGATLPASTNLSAAVTINGATVDGVTLSDPSPDSAPYAALFLVDASKNMEGWIAPAKQALERFLAEQHRTTPSVDRFAVRSFTRTVSLVVPFSAAEGITREALGRLRSTQQDRVRLWDSCTKAIGLFAEKDAAGNPLPTRRYLVIVTRGEGNEDDAGQERCQRAAIAQGVTVVAIAPATGQSRTRRGLLDVARATFGAYLEVAGPARSKMNGVLDGLRAGLSAASVRIASFDATSLLPNLRETGNQLSIELRSGDGTPVGPAFKRTFDLSETFRKAVEDSRPVEPSVPDGGNSPETPDAGGEVGVGDVGEGDAGEDASDAAAPPAAAADEESSQGWLLWGLVGLGAIAVVVIVVAVRRSRRRHCPDCGTLLPPGQEQCESCRSAQSDAAAPAAGPKPLAELIVREGPGKGSRFEIVVETNLMGRDPEKCQVVLDDDAVSRVHATLRRFPEGWRVTDMSSSYGVSVGGRKIAPEKWIEIRDGEALKIGNVAMVFIDKSRAGEAKP